MRTFTGTVVFQDSDSKDEVLKISENNVTIREELKPSKYNIKIGNTVVIENEPLELGGVYTIIITKTQALVEREDEYVSDQSHISITIQKYKTTVNFHTQIEMHSIPETRNSTNNTVK